ncbi:hypothetical protein [Vannielia litorea]|uniref:DUF3329 domain-containing protein n=1 Tax=Vannielia litorea TaxID=1217970 RepID=A0A1N6FVE6_9RHOB|nr:hypothetical protein [Vannielia litorea]SIN99255.1 hypothetical protein SAMN05444002_1992 [Vannielia litorea]
MNNFFNLQHPWFGPLWRRVLVTALCFAWAAFELAMGSPGWALLFAAAGAWCGYQFFVVWEDPGEGDG